jgi:hypothetical protein
MATQDSEALQGVATHQDTLRKKEQEWQAEAAIFSQWVAMVKAQQPGYGDDIDDEFGPEVEVRMPEFAVWAEHSKRKSD